MNPLAYIIQLFNTPSAFYDDPLAYARNVVLHAVLVGFVSAQTELLLPGYGFLGGGVVYAAWEGAQWLWRKAPPADCLEDWAFVQAGALTWLTLDWRLGCVAASFLAAGIVYRLDANRNREQ